MSYTITFEGSPLALSARLRERVRFAAHLLECAADAHTDLYEYRAQCWSGGNVHEVSSVREIVGNIRDWLGVPDGESLYSGRISDAAIGLIAVDTDAQVRILPSRRYNDYWSFHGFEAFVTAINHIFDVLSARAGGDILRHMRLPWEHREQIRRYCAPALALPWSSPLPALTRQRRKAGTGEEYTETLPALPALEPIEGHFAYAAITAPGSVAFTENASKGERDVQTVMRAGRYLRKFYPELSNEHVERYAANLAKCGELQFARTSDEIVEIYTTGPSSCMSHSASSYEDGHPCRVYGAPGDLTLAYMLGSDGKAMARALVWESKKVYGRVYGDQTALVPLLAAAGFEAGSLKGARIKRIPTTWDADIFVMPYIDGAQSYGLCGDAEFFVIGGDYDASSTTGVTERTCTCSICSECLSEDDAREHDGDHYCESCFHDSFAFCEYHNDYYPSGEVHEVYIRRRGTVRQVYWHESAPVFTCERSGEVYSSDDFTELEVITEDNGATETWCAETSEDYYYVCEGSSDAYADTVASVEVNVGTAYTERWALPVAQEGAVEVDGEWYKKGCEPAPEEAA